MIRNNIHFSFSRTLYPFKSWYQLRHHITFSVLPICRSRLQQIGMQKGPFAINERNIPLLSFGRDFSYIYPNSALFLRFPITRFLWTSKWRVRSDTRSIVTHNTNRVFLLDTDLVLTYTEFGFRIEAVTMPFNSDVSWVATFQFNEMSRLQPESQI